MVELTILFGLTQTLAIIVGVIIALMELRHLRQTRDTELETRQAQLFMQLMDKYLTKDGLENLRVEDGATWSSYEEWREIYQNDAEYHDAFRWLAHLYTGTGTLLREGLLNVRLVVLVAANGIIGDWGKYKDVIYEWRKRTNIRTVWSEWEYLYNTIMKYLEEHPELAP